MVEKISLVSTIRSTIHDTLRFVNYHLNIGIDGIILFFDDSNDPAAALLRDYSSVRSIRCDDAYWESRGTKRPPTIEERQEVNVNYGLKLAGEKGFEWIIHIDSDELLFCKNDIKQILSCQLGDVVMFSIKEAVAEKDYYENRFEAALFKEPLTNEGHSHVAKLLETLGCGDVLFEDQYFRGHMASKVAVRISSKIQWMGIHRVERPNLPAIKTNEIVLLHFDCIGIEDWKNKWSKRMDQSGHAARMGPHRIRQLELFKNAYGKAMDEKALYSRLYKLTEYQRRVLQRYGLLTVIRLKRELFDRPKSQVID